MATRFDVVGLLLLLPFAAFVLASTWLPEASFGRWPYTAHVAITSVLLLPWLRLRAYPDWSLGKLLLVELTAIAAVALLEFLFRGAGGHAADAVTLIIAAGVLVWYVMRERRRNSREKGRGAYAFRPSCFGINAK